MLEFKVTFNQNVKLGQNLFRTSDTTTVDEDVRDELLEVGVINANYETVTKAPGNPKAIEEMTVAELKEYAAENDIDLGDAKKRDEILEVIQAAENEESPEE